MTRTYRSFVEATIAAGAFALSPTDDLLAERCRALATQMDAAPASPPYRLMGEYLRAVRALERKTEAAKRPRSSRLPLLSLARR